MLEQHCKVQKVEILNDQCTLVHRKDMRLQLPRTADCGAEAGKLHRSLVSVE